MLPICDSHFTGKNGLHYINITRDQGCEFAWFQPSITLSAIRSPTKQNVHTKQNKTKINKQTHTRTHAQKNKQTNKKPERSIILPFYQLNR